MGLTLRVSGGPGSFELDERVITSVKTISDTPDDSNARSNDLALGVEVRGRIIANFQGGDQTLQLANWSMIPVEKSTCYGQVTLEYKHRNVVVRSVSIPNAFIVSYKEFFSVEEGEGTFVMQIRQKKDQNASYACTGSY